MTYDLYEEKLPLCANCVKPIWPHEDTVGNLDGNPCHENCPKEEDD